MMHIINHIKSIPITVLITLLLACPITFFVARYYYPANVDQLCENNLPLLANNVYSCSTIEQIVKNFETEGYTFNILEDTQTSRGPFHARFDYKEFEIRDYKIEGSPSGGNAKFQFINGRLSSIVYEPQSRALLFELYPETETNEIIVRHSTNYQGSKYISWSNIRLESYIAWWIKRFA